MDNLTLGAQQGDACQAGVQLAALTAQIAADSSIAPAGGTDGYTVTIHNPNSQGVTLNSISAVLPAGFSYTGGSTTGATTADPSFDSETQTATWNGPFTDPSKASLSLHFDVGVSDQVGQYTASASTSSLLYGRLTKPEAVRRDEHVWT